MAEISDYEKIRLQNIAERKQLWDEVMISKQEFDEVVKPKSAKPKKRKDAEPISLDPPRRSDRIKFSKLLQY